MIKKLIILIIEYFHLLTFDNRFLNNFMVNSAPVRLERQSIGTFPQQY